MTPTDHSHEPLHTSRRTQVFVVLAALFVTCLLIANLIGAMLIQFELPAWLAFGGQPAVVLLSAGIIPFPVTFLITDLLNEFFGQEAARFITWIGFAMSILVFGLLWLGDVLPVAPFSTFTHTQFSHFAGLYLGMFAASLTAYLVGQFLDIQIFVVFRKLTRGRFLWLRATGSTVVSQLFDSLLVSFIAFWGDHPASIIWSIAIGNYLWKFIVAVGITPLLYLGHQLIRRLMIASRPQPATEPIL